MKPTRCAVCGSKGFQYPKGYIRCDGSVGCGLFDADLLLPPEKWNTINALIRAARNDVAQCAKENGCAPGSHCFESPLCNAIRAFDRAFDKGGKG